MLRKWDGETAAELWHKRQFDIRSTKVEETPFLNMHFVLVFLIRADAAGRSDIPVVDGRISDLGGAALANF